LEQAFNSLDAQREACAAYIESQKHESWKLVRVAYDDGGYSGGTMERPALTKLLGDVDAGLIDTVVVYKIDRLTRSLADFAKIVERFEKRSVSFVSVTQAFNTTTSMGRLTLNVLLSFAQFEREVTAERIRDKIAASRARGIFMGGCPPLGYDARERKLVINKAEAETVRRIFTCYLALGSVGTLAAELNAKGITTKAWTSVGGKSVGGGSWYVGPLRHLLRNRVYVGDAVHKDKVYAGEHEPILERDLFEAVQALLERNRVARKDSIVRESPGLLTGLIFDDRGNAMTPQLSRKKSGAANVYYVSQALLQRRPDTAGSLPRVAATAIEGLVVQKLKAFRIGPKPGTREDVTLRDTLRAGVRRVQVGKEKVVITIPTEAIGEIGAASSRKQIDATLKRLSENEKVEVRPDAVVLSIETHLKTWGGAKRAEGWEAAAWTAHKPKQNKALIAALVRAHRWLDLILAGEVSSVEELAKREQTDRKYTRTSLRLALLAPGIQSAILRGRQPAKFSLTTLLDNELPPLWSAQWGADRKHRSP
jgi:DNA invertase Pin-like site-specific DNA recombinase